jgi:hypothetical protein
MSGNPAIGRGMASTGSGSPELTSCHLTLARFGSVVTGCRAGTAGHGSTAVGGGESAAWPGYLCPVVDRGRRSIFGVETGMKVDGVAFDPTRILACSRVDLSGGNAGPRSRQSDGLDRPKTGGIDSHQGARSAVTLVSAITAPVLATNRRATDEDTDGNGSSGWNRRDSYIHRCDAAAARIPPDHGAYSCKDVGSALRITNCR